MLNPCRLLLLLLWFPLLAWADLSIDSSLSFGEIAVRHNLSVSTTTVTRAGNQTSTNQILVIRPGVPGVYTLSELPPFTNIHLSVSLPVVSNMPYPGAQFAITAVDLPATVRTDSNGQVQFALGATLSTSGTGEAYQSVADYLLFINIDMTY